MSEQFYLFGLQRSGTTFFEHLLRSNFNCYPSNTDIWKHLIIPPSSLNKNIPLFHIIKNPYTWIESVIFRDPADLLVTSPSLLEGRPDEIYLSSEKINLARLAKLYVDYMENWSTVDKIVVKYEELLQPAMLDILLNRLKFERLNPSKPWQIPEPGSLFMSEGFSNKSIPYYLNCRPVHLTDEHVQLINSIIPSSLFRKLGYKKI